MDILQGNVLSDDGRFFVPEKWGDVEWEFIGFAKNITEFGRKAGDFVTKAKYYKEKKTSLFDEEIFKNENNISL